MHERRPAEREHAEQFIGKLKHRNCPRTVCQCLCGNERREGGRNRIKRAQSMFMAGGWDVLNMSKARKWYVLNVQFSTAKLYFNRLGKSSKDIPKEMLF